MLPIEKALKHTSKPAAMSASGRRIVVQHHVASVGPDFRYNRHFENFDPLEPGEIIGQDSKRVYRAPMTDNPVIFMPSAEETLRDETNTDAFFFGVEVATGSNDPSESLRQSA